MEEHGGVAVIMGVVLSAMGVFVIIIGLLLLNAGIAIIGESANHVEPAKHIVITEPPLMAPLDSPERLRLEHPWRNP